jgi:catechol 2,3-dioxygenase-like lactoylglutathione lyase family enzyme
VTSPYLPPTEQLVVEIFVRDLARSLAFYRGLGFSLLRAEPTFAELSWEGHRLFLDERRDHLPPAPPAANVRVMVPDVDARWAQVRELGAPVFQPIGDRYYGLRDFTILDPDGFGIRFASPLASEDQPG